MASDTDHFISDLPLLERSRLCEYLDSDDRWKEFAASITSYHSGVVSVSELDISRMECQASAGRSAAKELLNLLQEKHIPLYNIFICLKIANQIYAMDIIKNYVPETFHLYAQSKPILDADGDAAEPRPPPIEMVRDEMSASDASMEVERPGYFNNAAPRPQRPPMVNSPLFASSPSVTSPTEDEVRIGHTIITTRTFKYEDIARATDNFSDDCLIAKGKHGSVYKCKIDNTWMAVKKYDDYYEALKSDLQSTRNFNHPNIVPITGKSFESDHVIILYEYMSNGSLEAKLKERGTFAVDTRLDILMDAARGLQYLHSNNPPYIHGNIKSSNILLDDALRARLADFGMAQHANNGDDTNELTHYSAKASTSVINTNRGYNGPEVGLGKVSKKSDTFAFGVVIFEICTGKPAYSETERPPKLHEKCDDYQGDTFELRDQSIPWDQQTFTDLFQLAKYCVTSLRKNRPEMAKVYEKLDRIKREMQARNQQVHENSLNQQQIYVNLVPAEHPPPRPPPFVQAGHHYGQGGAHGHHYRQGGAHGHHYGQGGAHGHHYGQGGAHGHHYGQGGAVYYTNQPYQHQGIPLYQNLPSSHRHQYMHNAEASNSTFTQWDSSLGSERQLSSSTLGDLEIHSLKSESSYPDGEPPDPLTPSDNQGEMATNPSSSPSALRASESTETEFREEEVKLSDSRDENFRSSESSEDEEEDEDEEDDEDDSDEDVDMESYCQELLLSNKTDSQKSNAHEADEELMVRLDDLSLSSSQA